MRLTSSDYQEYKAKLPLYFIKTFLNFHNSLDITQCEVIEIKDITRKYFILNDDTRFPIPGGFHLFNTHEEALNHQKSLIIQMINRDYNKIKIKYEAMNKFLEENPELFI